MCAAFRFPGLALVLCCALPIAGIAEVPGAFLREGAVRGTSVGAADASAAMAGESLRDGSALNQSGAGASRQLALPELSRGASEQGLEAADFNSRLTGFPNNGGVAQAVPHGVSRADEGAGTRGLGFRLAPAPRRARWLSVETAYLNRRAEDELGNAEVKRNDVWGAALVTRLLDDRLTVQSEYALSRRLEQPKAGAVAQTFGSAYGLRARYRGDSVSLGPWPLRWRLALERQHTERGFWSLANSGLPGNGTADRVSTTLNWAALESRVRYTQAVEGDGGTQRNTLTSELVCNGPSLAWLPGLGALVGAPRYAVVVKQERRVPLVDAEDRALGRANSAEFHVRFDTGAWQWGVGHARTAAYRRGDTRRGDRTHLTLDLPISDWLDVESEFRWQALRDTASGEETTTLAGGLGGSATLLPRRLDAAVHLRAEQRRLLSEDARYRRWGLESSVEWTLPRHWISPSRANLSLNGRYELSGSRHAARQRYRAFASLRLRWPGNG